MVACAAAVAVLDEEPLPSPVTTAGALVLRGFGLLDDLLDLAAVDVEFSGYGSLAAARVVPCPYCLLHRWCLYQDRWCIVLRNWRSVARGRVRGLRLAGVMLCPDECHEEFERTFGARIFDWVSDLRFVVNAWVVMRRSGTRW